MARRGGPTCGFAGCSNATNIRSLRRAHGSASELSSRDVQILTGLRPESSAFGETAQQMRAGAAKDLGPAAVSLVGGCRVDLPSRQAGSHPYPVLLNVYDIVGPGVEVGVLEGAFSAGMIRHWRGLTHYTLVDLWAQQSSSVYAGDSANREDSVQADRFKRTMRMVVEPNAPRVSVLRMLSSDAAAHFGDESLAFVYLDANHGYQPVMDDLLAYYPKLMPGGLLAGHDFIHTRVFGVVGAVRDFATARNLTYVVTDPPLGKYREPICCSGWYLFKPKTGGAPSTRSPQAAAAMDCAAWWTGTTVPCSSLVA